jgi:hypothetical protein
MRYALGITAILLLMARGAAAGQLQVDIRPTDTPASLLTLSSSDLTLTPNGVGAFVVAFKSPGLYNAKLIVAIEKPPAGYDPFRMELDLPFFAADSLSLKVAAAIANDPLTDVGAANFVRGIGFDPGPGAIAENVLIHERARRYWAQRAADLANHVHAANLDDVGVAYWLLHASANLIDSSFYNPDDVTLNAVSFFKTKLADPSETSRLFLPNIVSKDVAAYLVRKIEARDSLLYSSIVFKLEGRLSVGDFSICDKIRALAQQVEEIPDFELTQFNGEFPTTVKAKTDAISCLSRHLTALAGAAPNPATQQEIADLIGAAADDISRGAPALAALSSPAGAASSATAANFAAALAALQQRLKELKTLQAAAAP